MSAPSDGTKKPNFSNYPSRETAVIGRCNGADRIRGARRLGAALTAAYAPIMKYQWQEYRTFLHRRVFGTGGNAFRHGDADGGERQQALAAVVAVSGWVDAFMGLSARSFLVDLMGDELPRIVERMSEPVLEGV